MHFKTILYKCIVAISSLTIAGFRGKWFINIQKICENNVKVQNILIYFIKKILIKELGSKNHIQI